LDWLLHLPEGLEEEHKQELRAYEESRTMPYITSIEKMGASKVKAD
jgi:hypothetical protein